jgi:hypothetical protein
MALTCRSCRYLSSFGTFCLLGVERSRCHRKVLREDAATMSELLIEQRIDVLYAEPAPVPELPSEFPPGDRRIPRA